MVSWYLIDFHSQIHLNMKFHAPFAILLCKFSDNDQNPYDIDRYEQIFTTAGAGKYCLPDYFSAMSHGQIDLSGSKIYGWFKLPMKRIEYTGSGINQDGRRALVALAKQTAEEEGVNLNTFHSVVIVFNVDTDLFGGLNGAVCSDDGQQQKTSGLSPSLVAQEMGHTFGLNHSKMDGSEDP